MIVSDANSVVPSHQGLKPSPRLQIRFVVSAGKAFRLTASLRGKIAVDVNTHRTKTSQAHSVSTINPNCAAIADHFGRHWDVANGGDGQTNHAFTKVGIL